MNYKELNDIVSDFVNDSKSMPYLETIGNIKKLIELVLLNYSVFFPSTFSSNVSISDSIKISDDFFKSIDDKYSKEFLRLLNDKDYYEGTNGISNTVEFTKVPKYFNHEFKRSGVTKDGKVYIDYNETLDDIFSICHEIVHRFSYRGNESVIKRYFGETTTILTEFYLEDYLINNTNYDYDEITLYKKKRFFLVYEEALSAYIQMILVELYLENGVLNENILLEHLKSLSNLEFFDDVYNKSLDEIKYIIASGNLNFFIRQRYIIGLICALEMKKEDNFDNFKKLVEILGNDDSTFDKDILELQQIIPIFSDRDFSFDKSKERIIQDIKDSINTVKVGEKCVK